MIFIYEDSLKLKCIWNSPNFWVKANSNNSFIWPELPFFIFYAVDISEMLCSIY